MKRKLINISLFFISLTISLIAAEYTSRFILPISPGAQNITIDGQVIENILKPGAKYYQSSTEYHAFTSITGKGYRVPESKDPIIIFLGDSFTFGQGLSDQETFVYIYFRAMNVPCANLAIPGSGTKMQLDKLESCLINYNWHPKQIKLFFMGMTKSFLAGNDFADNLYSHQQNCIKMNEELNKPFPNREKMSKGWISNILKHRKSLLKCSNLLRIIKFYLGPELRSKIQPSLKDSALNLALHITAAQLKRLNQMSRKYDFDYVIYLLHPMQDIINETYHDTYLALNEISPKQIKETAHLFKEKTTTYYYKYDGHLNAKGSSTIANWLIEIDKK